MSSVRLGSRGFASLVVLGMLLALVAFFPSSVGAVEDECRATCKDSKRTCAHVAKAASRSCKEDCRGAESRRDCRRSCRAAFIDVRNTCASVREDCQNDCEVEPPPPAECVHCRAELRVCLHGVAREGKACVMDCVSSRRAAARECKLLANPVPCFLQVAQGAAQCLHGCAEGMKTGAQGCHDSHTQCRFACEGEGAYGSASQAFLLWSVDLLE